MQVDAPLVTQALAEVPPRVRELEAAGYDGVYTFEGPHDPFLPLLLAAEHSDRLHLTTAVAIAFARNPMLLANLGHDLQLASEGRFTLGLGSQIRPHVERRFSMPWSRPAARMRELVLAIRAIWACWQEGVPLDFRGEFYSHTLMTPFFDPGPNPHGPPRIALAGVGPMMTEAAGEVADSFLVHPFTTERYLRESIVRALERGLARSGRTLADLDVGFPLMVVTGANESDRAAARAAVTAQIAFYASTPAYRPVLDAHGWGDLQPELRTLSKSGDWAAMAGLVPDELVDAVAVTGAPDSVGSEIRRRYGDLVDRISINAPYTAPADVWSQVLADLHGP